MLVDIGGVKMNDSGKLYEVNDAGKIVRQNAGRKGGRRRVKKGFATMNKDRLKAITSEAGKKGMAKRWHETDNIGSNSEQEKLQD